MAAWLLNLIEEEIQLSPEVQTALDALARALGAIEARLDALEAAPASVPPPTLTLIAHTLEDGTVVTFSKEP